ncbi:hypothetical protein QBC41DRAFT_322845 [Cercophora samala]|uniref:Uncharacterized protein n=1 Tax=Cercophora samala TaxID=330535 RepID=A0AA39ZBN2_9PEZI|nr:hypothetical protein QBC41DRAFT_322845 [Cercophora samala]
MSFPKKVRSNLPQLEPAPWDTPAPSEPHPTAHDNLPAGRSEPPPVSHSIVFLFPGHSVQPAIGKGLARPALYPRSDLTMASNLATIGPLNFGALVTPKTLGPLFGGGGLARSQQPLPSRSITQGTAAGMSLTFTMFPLSRRRRCTDCIKIAVAAEEPVDSGSRPHGNVTKIRRRSNGSWAKESRPDCPEAKRTIFTALCKLSLYVCLMYNCRVLEPRENVAS